MESRELLAYIHEYQRIFSSNVTIISQYNEIVQNLILKLRYNLFVKDRESLLEELELSKRFKKSSDITASTDLLKKMSESFTDSKRKLGFLEEDFVQQKNQIDQIRNKINEYNSKIQELTKQKKDCFSQINRITREMTGATQEPKKEANNSDIMSNIKISNAEKIKNFQMKAKELQYEINKIKSKKSQTQLHLEEKTPIFEIYENDYQTLLEKIKSEEKRINDLQSELKNNIRDGEDPGFQDLDIINLKSFRTSQEIKNDLEEINSELKQIDEQEVFNILQNHSDLSHITKKLKEFDENIRNHEEDFLITLDQKGIYKCFEEFRKLEKTLNKIESFLNKFISEINMTSELKIIVNEDNSEFFIDIRFIKNGKDKVDFDGLTTPEKIFFIISFYISIKLCIKRENIILSNISILNKYNKAGSIYRAIRKILPIFEKEDDLSRFNIIFIISNLEFKKEIKNLNIKTIEES
jgi:hypothetical protein